MSTYYAAVFLELHNPRELGLTWPLTWGLFNWKLAHCYSCPKGKGTFIPFWFILRLSIFDLGARMGQTDRQME